MPATYLSFEVTPEMTLEEKQARLYLAMISAGEQAYSIGAAIAELRKQSDAIDDVIVRLRKDFQTLKAEVRNGRDNRNIMD